MHDTWKHKNTSNSHLDQVRLCCSHECMQNNQQQCSETTIAFRARKQQFFTTTEKRTNENNTEFAKCECYSLCCCGRHIFPTNTRLLIRNNKQHNCDNGTQLTTTANTELTDSQQILHTWADVF